MLLLTHHLSHPTHPSSPVVDFYRRVSLLHELHLREQPGVYIPSFPQGGHRRRLDDTGLEGLLALSPVPKPLVGRGMTGTRSGTWGNGNGSGDNSGSNGDDGRFHGQERSHEGSCSWSNHKGNSFMVGTGNITARSPLIERRVLDDLTGPLHNLTGTARSPLIERRILNDLTGNTSAEKRVPKSGASKGVHSNKRKGDDENTHPNRREREGVEEMQLMVFGKVQHHQKQQPQQQEQQQQQPQQQQRQYQQQQQEYQHEGQQEEQEENVPEQESHIDIGDLLPLRSLDQKGVSVVDHQHLGLFGSCSTPLLLRPYLHINNSMQQTPTDIAAVQMPSSMGKSPCLFSTSGPSPCPHAVSPSPGPFAKSRPSPCPHADDYSPTVMSFTDCVDVEESGFEHGREESEDTGGYANSR